MLARFFVYNISSSTPLQELTLPCRRQTSQYALSHSFPLRERDTGVDSPSEPVRDTLCSLVQSGGVQCVSLLHVLVMSAATSPGCERVQEQRHQRAHRHQCW